MPKAENERKTPDTPPADGDAAAVPAQPSWGTEIVEFLKKYQNVFYAAATVALLAYAIIKFRASQRERDENDAAWELSQAQSADAVKALLNKYPDLTITPLISFEHAVRLAEDGQTDPAKMDEAIAAFEETNRKWPETVAGKLAGQRLKTLRENKTFPLDVQLGKLKAEEEKDKPKKDTTSTTIDPKELPRVELTFKAGKVVVELDEDNAPNTTANFIRLVEMGQYEKYQVTKLEKDQAASFGIPGGKTMFTIPFETCGLPAKAGSVAMLRTLPKEGEADSDALKATASADFAIMTGEAPQYEGRLLFFARVVEGLDIVRGLQPGDTIEKAHVLRMRRAEYTPKENPK